MAEDGSGDESEDDQDEDEEMVRLSLSDAALRDTQMEAFGDEIDPTMVSVRNRTHQR